MDTAKTIITTFIASHPADAARILEGVNINDISDLIANIPDEFALTLLSNMEQRFTLRLLKKIAPQKSAGYLSRLSLHHAAILLRDFPAEEQTAILQLIPNELSAKLSSLIRYPQNSAGALLSTSVVSIPSDLTVKEARKRMQKHDAHEINYLYVVSREHKLHGIVRLEQLITTSSDKKLAALMQTEFDTLKVHFNFKAILNHPGWDMYHALPVVDEAGLFLGEISYKTIKKITSEGSKRLPGHAVAVSNALGELYQIGLSGLLKGASFPFSTEQKDKNESSKSGL